MKTDFTKIPDFDDIIFEIRNKEYGAYLLRKKYRKNVNIGMLIGIIIVSTVVITPYFRAMALETKEKDEIREVKIRIENLDQANQIIVPPAAPILPPEEVVQQAKYIPPVIVDSVKPGDIAQLMTAEQAQIEVRDENVVEIVPEAKDEIAEEKPEAEPFYVVEEMPMYPGGDIEIIKFITENVEYPILAIENNVQGRVIVKFCVTPAGGVDKIEILRGVDPELDAEVIRVLKTLLPFRPGKQGGRAVPVWYTIPITFQLKQN